MRALLSRLIFTLAVLGTALTSAPRFEPHCGPPASAQAAHHDHHDHAAKDTDGAEECPHCPPAECRRHTQCTVTADPAWSDGQDAPVPPSGLERTVLAPQIVRSLSSQPPTPPPDYSGRTNV